MKQKNRKSKNASGITSGLVLVLAAILIILVIVIFVVVRVSSVKKTSTTKPNGTTSNGTPVPPPPPAPIYDTTINTVRFVFESATDLGNVLQSKDPQFQPNLTTTEKFIRVVVGAQNKGKMNTQPDSWDVGNIVDSEGRNFVTINDKLYSGDFAYVPNPNLCGTLLKPEFEPTPCVKIYEVSKESTGLKVEVNITSPDTSKKIESSLDLNVNE